MRLNLAKQAGRIGVWEREGEDQRSWWSNSFYGVVGLDPSTPPDSRLFASMIVDEDRQQANAAIDTTRAGDSFDFTFRFRDNTELHQLSDKLEAANALLESRVAERTAERDRTWALSRDLFAVTDMGGKLLAVNPAWQDLLGWSEQDLIGQPIGELIHSDDIAAMQDRFARLIGGEVLERIELRLRHRDGRWRWIAWTAVPEGGQVHAVGRDVTAEREAAVELADAQAALHEAQKLETLGQLRTTSTTC